MRRECFPPPLRFKGNRELAIPACITARASRTCRDACRDCLPAVAGKTFPTFPAHAHPQFYVFGKRPIRTLTDSEQSWRMLVTTVTASTTRVSLQTTCFASYVASQGMGECSVRKSYNWLLSIRLWVARNGRWYPTNHVSGSYCDRNAGWFSEHARERKCAWQIALVTMPDFLVLSFVRVWDAQRPAITHVHSSLQRTRIRLSIWYIGVCVETSDNSCETYVTWIILRCSFSILLWNLFALDWHSTVIEWRVMA